VGSTYQSDIPGNRHLLALGSTAAIASNGAPAILGQSYFVANAPLKVHQVYKIATANEVTAGTSVSSASYRRFQLMNGTKIMASLNNTASTAAGGSKGFATTANNTMAAGDIGYLSHLTVGAASADATDSAAGPFIVEFELI